MAVRLSCQTATGRSPRPYRGRRGVFGLSGDFGMSRSAPSSDRTRATASSSTERPPSIFCLAGTWVPSHRVTPAILGATTSKVAPSYSMAQLADGIGDQFVAKRLIANIAGQGDGVALFGANQIHHFLGIGFFRRQVVGRHVRAFAREGDGRRAAVAGIAAGNQCLAPSQAPGALVAGFAMIGTRLQFADQARPRLLLRGGNVVAFSLSTWGATVSPQRLLHLTLQLGVQGCLLLTPCIWRGFRPEGPIEFEIILAHQAHGRVGGAAEGTTYHQLTSRYDEESANIN